MTDPRTSLPPQLLGLASLEGKDLERERRLARLNELLQPVGQRLEAAAPTAPRWPPVFVFGPPRSGTTVLSQALAATRLLGFVSNFAARFWRAPALGMLIEATLGLRTDAPASNFASDHGLTAGWAEPNEFGYFWSSHFDLGGSTHALGPRERERLDREALRRAIAAMESTADAPMAFKNNTWFTLQADLLAEIFPGCVLVACRRDPFFTAQSCLQMRRRLYGDDARWWSVRPADHAALVALPPLEQVAAQAISIGAGMEHALARARAAGAAVVDASYARLASDPRGLVREVALAAGLGAEAVEPALERVPARFESTDRARLAPAEADALREAVSRQAARYTAAPATL